MDTIIKDDGKYDEILISHKIKSTPIRKQILHIVKNHSGKYFTITELLDSIKKEKLLLSTSSCALTLRLFAARGLLKFVKAREFPLSKDQKKGRRKIQICASSIL